MTSIRIYGVFDLGRHSVQFIYSSTEIPQEIFNKSKFTATFAVIGIKEVTMILKSIIHGI